MVKVCIRIMTRSSKSKAPLMTTTMSRKYADGFAIQNMDKRMCNAHFIMGRIVVIYQTLSQDDKTRQPQDHKSTSNTIGPS